MTSYIPVNQCWPVRIYSPLAKLDLSTLLDRKHLTVHCFEHRCEIYVMVSKYRVQTINLLQKKISPDPHNGICLLLRAQSTCLFLFNLYFLYVFVVMYPVFLASFCFSVPGWWYVMKIFLLVCSPLRSGKSVQIWLCYWHLYISSGILKLSPVASVSLHFTWNVYHWTPRNSPIFYSMNIHGTAPHVFWNFFHLTKLKMIKCLLWKLIIMTLKPD